MTLEYDSQSDDDGEIVVSKRKRNAILDNESDDEDTVDVLNQTNKIDDVVNGGDSMEDEPINDDSNVVSSKIRTLSKESDNESDADGSSIGGQLSNNDEIEDSNQSEILSKICDNVKPIEKKYTFDPSVYDAEESDEEIRSKTPEVVSEDERICDDVQNKFPTSEKSVVKDKSSKHQNKGSKQKPSDNMREIRRESQRMVRESQVILPYHIPKQRTLAEFLNRKKSAPSIPIRTTAEQLISLSKQIQQLEKESQEFFKSDSSDGDDDGDEDYVPECDRNAKTESAQDNKTLIDGDDNEADKSRVDENFNKEKVISKSDIEEIGCGESNKDESNTKIDEKSSSVASILADVADRLQNDIVDNSLEGATQSDTVQTTSESTEIGCQISDGNRTQLSQLSTEKSYFCKKNLLISNNTDDSTNNACLETNSNQHLAEKDESDCEDFTLDLTMPEDSEMVEEVKEKDKESFTLDLTMPEDSINLLGNKEENEKKDSLVKDNKISSDCGIDNLFETKDQVNTNLYSSKKNSFSNKSKKIELLSKINVDLTKVPTLSKSFGGEINLDSPPKKSGVVDLRERFFKHYAMDRKKKKSKSPVKVSVVSAVLDGKGHVEDISKEVIRASSKPDEQWLEEIKEAELPGAKHSKLKAFLESKAKAKWKEDYEKRLQEYKMNEEEIVENDKADYEHEAILDDEDEEADMTNSEEEDDEEELEEDDVQLVDKRRKQSKFVEDEADVSEDEMEGDNGGDEDEEEEEVVEEKEEDLLGYNESDDEDSDSENRDRRKKKTKKRITERNVYNNDECEDDSENSEESESESPKRKTKLIPSDNEEKSQSMEDLGGICSGKFPTQPESFSQLDSDKLLNGFADTSSQSDGESQTFDLSLPEQSQLLDRSQEESEEEEEGTKRKKTSTLDSDDDEEEDAIVLNRSHKKRAKAVEYSDDEDEKSKPEIQNDDDLESENSEELVLDEIGNEELELEYDSEENEVVRDPKAFIEKEAELSESEWGSEDEDEKDLDKFEEEAGDQEVLDEDEVNRELGKIHMQQMLVDDKRDVRILQELLLEDGELHSDGSGRQRQFRWANADSGFAGGDPTMKDSDDDDSDQGEDEENWRKKRHERELFLNKKNARLKELGIEEEDEEDEKDDGLLGMGRALAKKMQNSSSKQPVNVTSRVSAAAVTMNCKFMAKNMRGSFLTSSEQYLSRLAHITTKVGSESNVNGPKNSRNFVFSIVSPKKEEEKEAVTEDIKLKKRKASENATNAKKKILFSDDKGNEKRKSLLDALG